MWHSGRIGGASGSGTSGYARFFAASGVEESDREMIFEPFWQKNGTTPGTGLGLAIAKELVEKHHGRIWVEDTPGGGATFKVALPL